VHKQLKLYINKHMNENKPNNIIYNRWSYSNGDYICGVGGDMPASDCNSTGHINQSNLGYMVGVTGSYSKTNVSNPLGHQVALAVGSDVLRQLC